MPHFVLWPFGILQKCLASHESSGIDIIVALVMKDIDSKSEEDDVDIRSYMKLKVGILCAEECQ